MEVFVVDKWEQDDLASSQVDKVFLSEKSAKHYITEMKAQEAKEAKRADDFYCYYMSYNYRITKRTAMP